MYDNYKYYRRWDYLDHCYYRVTKPANWKCSIYEVDLDTIVNCIECGKKIKFGDSFTSMEYHTEIGFGYAVCEHCYNKEWERRRSYERDLGDTQ